MRDAGGDHEGRSSALAAREDDTPFLPDPRLAADAQACVVVLQELVARRQSLAWRMGRALARAYTRREHLDHRYLNFSAYVSDELGMGRRRAELLRALDGRLERVPALREAYRTARLGWNKTWTLTRICGQEAAWAWIERAERLTLRGLERQAEAGDPAGRAQGGGLGGVAAGRGRPNRQGDTDGDAEGDPGAAGGGGRLPEDVARCREADREPARGGLRGVPAALLRGNARDGGEGADGTPRDAAAGRVRVRPGHHRGGARREGPDPGGRRRAD